MALKGVAIALIAAVVGLIVLQLASGFLVDWAWFASIGRTDVFWTVFGTKAGLFVAVLAASAVALGANGLLAQRHAGSRSPWQTVAYDPRLGIVPGTAPRLPSGLSARFLIGAGALVLAILVAAGETGNWDLVLRYMHQVPYGQRDPLFDRDLGFYLFSLPAYVALKNWAFLMVALCAALAGVVYWANGAIMLDRRPPRIAPAVLAHGSVLLALGLAVKAGSYLIDRFLLLYDDNGVVVGAGYTDVHVELPMLGVMAGLAALAALAAAANVRRRSVRLPVAALTAVLGGSFVLTVLVPGLLQRFYVKPNELALEAPYLARNIASTQEAFNLRNVTVKPFPATQGLSFQSLQDNRATVDNIRLWDWQPLMDTYAQLQEIRTYYKFHDVDIDRYTLGGDYQQVTVSARELDPRLLPPNAQTWVNLHLLFTHGDGVVMSPVTRKTSEGLPLFYLKDIPPIADGGPEIAQPRVYFGQGTDGYVIVKASVPEFDFPQGKDNAYTRYDGADGVPIGGLARRSLFAWYLGDLNILLTSYITGDSRILLHRNIQERVQAIAPFLQLDRDPYMVISGGRLIWLQDAYTTSAWFPYAQSAAGGASNYIRNAVKIAIDAYDGTATFYLADPADPIAATWRRIFPGLFKPIGEMPPDLAKHVRYPEDLFLAQAQLYRAYHMEAPEVFYNREDLWQFPREPSNADVAAEVPATPRGLPPPSGLPGFGVPSPSRMAPYYVVMRLPGERRAEFFLMLPMVPSQRENMIAWLAARCDAPDYGKLIVYEFPKEKLVYGPFQIEARINQDPTISQQISLWNQMGSRVIRGNLLVIPIENSLLYVSPLYLRAETGQLPELKRVIAAYGDRVVMDETLAGALAALFKEGAPAAAPPAPVASTAVAPDDRARAAREHYQRALERLKAGDWAGFGTELDALGPLLDALAHPPQRP